MGINALSTALSGLRAAQLAMETASNNIANAGTDGYRRQRLDTKPAISRPTAWGPMGTGVEVIGVSRSTDGFLDDRVRTTLGDFANLSTREDIGLGVEDGFGEPSNGISSTLTRLWSAFADLATNPTDSGTGQQLLSTLGDVAGRINSVAGEIDSLSQDAVSRLSTEVDAVNDLSRRVAEINRQSGGSTPPDLADERDRALDELSRLVGAKAEPAADGSVRVTVNGMAIVDGDRSMDLRVDPASPGVVLHPAGPVIGGGVVGGLQTAITKDLPGHLALLNNFATGLRDALNLQHSLNKKPDGTFGGPLLAGTAGSMTVVVTNVSDLATANAAGGLQNGLGASALADLRTSMDPAVRTMIGGVSNDVGRLSRSVTAAKVTSQAAAGSRDSVTGVNIDEEMTSLIASQRAYAAAAKVISTVDQMLDTLIRM
jgi:flagellar hook-associated protein 1 FlgK